MDAQELAPAIVSGLTVGALGLAGGGYRAPTWGWATLALVAGSVAVLVALGLPRLGRLEIVFLGGLAALCVWTLASAGWSLDRAQAVLESQRILLYVAGSLALLLAARRSSVSHLLGGVLTAVTAICATALSIRLFPDSVHSGGAAFSADPQAVLKLAEPLGYANALGALAAIGIAVALGLAARAETIAGSALAAASLPVLAATLYLTFGRAAWLALGAGLAAALVLDPRRLQLVTALLALTPAPALAVLLASHSDGLTSSQASLAEIESDGRSLALALALLAALAAVSALALRYAERHVHVGPRLTRSYAAALLVVLVVVAVAAIGRAGGPIDLADRAYEPSTRRRHPRRLTLADDCSASRGAAARTTGALPGTTSRTTRSSAPAPAAMSAAGSRGDLQTSRSAMRTVFTSRHWPSSGRSASCCCSAPSVRPWSRRSQPALTRLFLPRSRPTAATSSTPGSTGTGRCRR